MKNWKKGALISLSVLLAAAPLTALLISQQKQDAGVVGVDKTKLAKLIKESNEVNKNKFTNKTLVALHQTNIKAVEIYDDQLATQDVVDKMVVELQGAIDALSVIEIFDFIDPTILTNSAIGIDILADEQGFVDNFYANLEWSVLRLYEFERFIDENGMAPFGYATPDFYNVVEISIPNHYSTFEEILANGVEYEYTINDVSDEMDSIGENFIPSELKRGVNKIAPKFLEMEDSHFTISESISNYFYLYKGKEIDETLNRTMQDLLFMTSEINAFKFLGTVLIEESYEDGQELVFDITEENKTFEYLANNSIPLAGSLNYLYTDINTDEEAILYTVDLAEENLSVNFKETNLLSLQFLLDNPDFSYTLEDTTEEIKERFKTYIKEVSGFDVVDGVDFVMRDPWENGSSSSQRNITFYANNKSQYIRDIAPMRSA
ncbi:hypothetical protein [[Acholeplasma] multilocale]|uniref:hypothetical protein n=1 Tax=[Acholeplasma] multilocale TaxID=264638 RepID=UPI000479B4C5|nr:hypothetical protein [[Acholeplasma] multilocale]